MASAASSITNAAAASTSTPEVEDIVAKTARVINSSSSLKDFFEKVSCTPELKEAFYNNPETFVALYNCHNIMVEMALKNIGK